MDDRQIAKILQDITKKVRKRDSRGKPPWPFDLDTLERLKQESFGDDAMTALWELWRATGKLNEDIEQERRAWTKISKYSDLNAKLVWPVADLMVTQRPTAETVMTVARQPFYIASSDKYTEVVGGLLAKSEQIEGVDLQAFWDALGEGARFIATSAVTKKRIGERMRPEWYAEAFKIMPGYFFIRSFSRMAPSDIERALGCVGDSAVEAKNLVGVLDELEPETWAALSRGFVAQMMTRKERAVREVVLAKGMLAKNDGKRPRI